MNKSSRITANCRLSTLIRVKCLFLTLSAGIQPGLKITPDWAPRAPIKKPLTDQQPLNSKLPLWSQGLKKNHFYAFNPSPPLYSVDKTLTFNTSLHFTIFRHWKGARGAETYLFRYHGYDSCFWHFQTQFVHGCRFNRLVWTWYNSKSLMETSVQEIKPVYVTSPGVKIQSTLSSSKIAFKNAIARVRCFIACCETKVRTESWRHRHCSVAA